MVISYRRFRFSLAILAAVPAILLITWLFTQQAGLPAGDGSEGQSAGDRSERQSSASGTRAETSMETEGVRPVESPMERQGTVTIERYEGQAIDQYEPAHLEYFDVLMEIGNRLAEAQIEEADNELRAFVTRMQRLPAADKLAFIDFIVAYTPENLRNPEALAAFDQLWRMLELDDELRIEGARRLAAHYVSLYEFEFAIGQFDYLTEAGADLDTQQLRDYGHALFQMHDYEKATQWLLDYSLAAQTAGEPLDRAPLSELFEAYYRTGDYTGAEVVGLDILDRFADVQDWKDMMQFYSATDNSSGKELLKQRAKDTGLMDESGQWLP